MRVKERKRKREIEAIEEAKEREREKRVKDGATRVKQRGKSWGKILSHRMALDRGKDRATVMGLCLIYLIVESTINLAHYPHQNSNRDIVRCNSVNYPMGAIKRIILREGSPKKITLYEKTLTGSAELWIIFIKCYLYFWLTTIDNDSWFLSGVIYLNSERRFVQGEDKE